MSETYQVEHSDLECLERYIKKYYPNLKGKHFTDLVDIIYMAALRNKINIHILCEDLYHGILDIEKYRRTSYGNVYNFLLDSKYKLFSDRIKDIVVGSNGGGAGRGRGEWLVSLLSGINKETKTPRVIIIKTGKGDIQYTDNDKTEEIKWNKGKVFIEQAGNVVQQKFNELIKIKDEKFVPFREKDKKIYSKEKLEKYNSVYWNAISGEKNDSLSDDNLKLNIIRRAFEQVLEKTDSFVMFNDDGEFQRFFNIKEVEHYYKPKLKLLKSGIGFECRATQINPISLYCHVFPPENDPLKDYNKMKSKELDVELKAKRVKGFSKMKKAEKIAKLSVVNNTT